MSEGPERQKLELEIAELRQKLRWEPLRSIATFAGVAVVLAGLGLERCALQEQRSFDLALRQHQARLGEMRAITSDVSTLCAETLSVLLAKTTQRVTAPLMGATLRDTVRDIAKSADAEDRAVIEGIVAELERLQQALTSELGDYRLWTEAIRLQGAWTARQNSPAPGFTLYFPDALLPEWQEVAARMDEMISGQFGILDSGDVAVSVDPCLTFVGSLEAGIVAEERAFCEANAREAC